MDISSLEQFINKPLSNTIQHATFQAHFNYWPNYKDNGTENHMLIPVKMSVHNLKRDQTV